MAKRKKPTLLDSAAKGGARSLGPEDDLRLSILCLLAFEGLSLQDLADATGIDFDQVDRYLVGQEPVSRQLVERFCQVAGTCLPRVELALPMLRWTFGLIASKKVSEAAIEHEGRLQAAALKVALSAYDAFLKGVMGGLTEFLGENHRLAGTLEAGFQSLAGAYAQTAGEAYRMGARESLRSGEAASLRPDEEDAAD